MDICSETTMPSAQTNTTDDENVHSFTLADKSLTGCWYLGDIGNLFS